VLLRKLVLVIVLAVLGLVYLGWLPKEKAQRFVRFMIAFFMLGFVYRVGVWCLSP
jgi:hypothetical protein